MPHTLLLLLEDIGQATQARYTMLGIPESNFFYWLGLCECRFGDFFCLSPAIRLVTSTIEHIFRANTKVAIAITQVAIAARTVQSPICTEAHFMFQAYAWNP